MNSSPPSQFVPTDPDEQDYEMPYTTVPWKPRSYQNIPSKILKALDAIITPYVVVAQIKEIPISDIGKGLYKHLGLSVVDAKVVSKDPVLPPGRYGIWSTRNRDGWEIKRDDLPKITKTFTTETPNFGDGARYGYRTHHRDREVYQVELEEPRRHLIHSEIIRTSAGERATVQVKFSIETLIEKDGATLGRELLWALNVLQENAGVVGVYSSDATREDYLGTVSIDWTIFPPGTADEIIAAFRARRTGPKTKVDTVMEERLRLFHSLRATGYLAGAGQLTDYVGAQFADDLVVFENPRYGNALYVLYDDWREVSKRSRIDLLKGTSERFTRFVHTKGWEDRLRHHMRAELEKRDL